MNTFASAPSFITKASEGWRSGGQAGSWLMSSVGTLYMAPWNLITPVMLPAVFGSTTTSGALDAGVVVGGAGRDSHPRRESAMKNNDERRIFICLVHDPVMRDHPGSPARPVLACWGGHPITRWSDTAPTASMLAMTASANSLVRAVPPTSRVKCRFSL